jgi:heat shock protein HslJ
MKFNILFNRRSISCALILLLGSAIVTVVTPGMAQQFAETASVQTAQASSALQGSWQLANMTAPGSPMPMLPAAENPLTATFESDRVSGFAGCNNFMGSFSSGNGQMAVGELATTLKICEQAIMDQEAFYLNALRSAERYQVNRQQELTISYRVTAGSGVLRFNRTSAAQVPPVSPAPPVASQNNFQGRGVAQGSAFTQGRNANVSLTLNRDNFSLELSEPTVSGRGQTNAARVEYRGVVRRQENQRGNSGSFTLSTRVRSFVSSANLRAIPNTTGTCRIEVFDSRVVSTNCRTAIDDSATQFLGLEQF